MAEQRFFHPNEEIPGLPTLRARVVRALGAPPKSVHTRLRLYKDLMKEQQGVIDFLVSWREAGIEIASEATGLKRPANSSKRWSPEDDEALISLASEGNTKMAIAVTLARTPAAVASRLTYLVGVHRISQEIAGRIIGYLDGMEVDAYFEGRYEKEVG